MNLEYDVLDIPFSEVDGQSLYARHYRPRAGGPVPTLVEVHGGAWINGNRLTNSAIHEYLAARGIGVFALDFRSPPIARYPDSVEDIRNGVRWLRDNAESLGVYVPWIGGLGTSSGGHLILLAALSHTEVPGGREDHLPEKDNVLKYVVACWPILDPWARYQMAQLTQKENLIKAHEAFWPDEISMRKGSPQGIVDRMEQRATPPLLLIQGTDDANVEYQRAYVFASAYKKAGGEVNLQMYEGEKHAFISSTPFSETALKALESITKFVFSQAKPENTIKYDKT